MQRAEIEVSAQANLQVSRNEILSATQQLRCNMDF